MKIRSRNFEGEIREVDSEVVGIIGACGGYANCATCHVYVDDEWIDKLPQIDEAEDVMLGGAMSERTPFGRLSCQLVLTPEL